MAERRHRPRLAAKGITGEPLRTRRHPRLIRYCVPGIVGAPRAVMPSDVDLELGIVSPELRPPRSVVTSGWTAPLGERWP